MTMSREPSINLFQDYQDTAFKWAYLGCLQDQGDDTEKTSDARFSLSCHMAGMLEGVLASQLGTVVRVFIGSSEAFVTYRPKEGLEEMAVGVAATKALGQMGVLEYLPFGVSVNPDGHVPGKQHRTVVRVKHCEKRGGRLLYTLPADTLHARAAVGRQKVPLHFVAGCPATLDVSRYRRYIGRGRFKLEITLNNPRREPLRLKERRKDDLRDRHLA